MLNYTTEDLILYLYKETTMEQSKAIEQAMSADWNLREKFIALKESMNQLDTIKASPRPQTIAAILNYAKSTAPVEHP